MDEYFNAALHGFEGMRRSGPAWRYSIRSSQRPQFRSDPFSVFYDLYNKHEFHTLFIHVTAIAPGPI